MQKYKDLFEKEKLFLIILLIFTTFPYFFMKNIWNWISFHYLCSGIGEKSGFIDALAFISHFTKMA